MIPKKLHYIWFGNNEKPQSVKDNIENWQKKLPDYEIIEWNESNFPVEKFNFVREALQNKKYAFASDVARLWVIYEYGGIYLDTDVEILRSFDSLLENKAFIGTEEADSINSGLGFGSEPQNTDVKDLLALYGEHFVVDGKFDETTTNVRVTRFFVKNGYKLKNKKQVIKSFTIYPKEYFAPIQWWDNKDIQNENTYSIHKYDASWVDKDESKSISMYKHLIVLEMRKLFGYNSFDFLKSLLRYKSNGK